MSGPEFRDRVRRALSCRKALRIEDPSLQRASVLLPLFADVPGCSPGLWLPRRPQGMRGHQGQVALPGGKLEPQDPDLLATALREAHEEIGLFPHDVDVLGQLDDYATV